MTTPLLVVHHLNNSRSQRVLWLLEELQLPYTIQNYTRQPNGRAPPELRAIHPLGKSPVIEVDGKIIAESGLIVDFLIRKFGTQLMPAFDSSEYDTYQYWMHFAEGSAMLPLLLKLYLSKLGDGAAPLLPFVDTEIANHFKFINDALEGKNFFLGENLSGADFMMLFVLEGAQSRGALKVFPNLEAYVLRMQAREAYQKGVERGGAYAFFTPAATKTDTNL